MPTWIGVDFSGDHRKWRPGVGASNIWISEIHGDSRRLRVQSLRRVQQLPGNDHPFPRLIQFIGDGQFEAVSIDAPFSVPEEFILEGGHPGLLEMVAGLDHFDRPFPEANTFVRNVAPGLPEHGRKLYRATEQYWKDQGINVRSTTWAGPRGGAAFTVACLKLLRDTDARIWPWAQDGQSLLVEAFPGAQLFQWGLPFQQYNGKDSPAPQNRRIIVEGVQARFPNLDLREFTPTLEGDADALDSLLCAFAGMAVRNDTLVVQPSPVATHEGWIAVHD